MLKAAREAKGWTQDELAERIGVSRGTVWRWEDGRGLPLVPGQFNDVVAALELSAERALREMGVNLYPPAITRLPKELQDVLLALTPAQHLALLELVRPLAIREARK